MDKLKPRLEGDVLKLQNVTLMFCGKGVDPPEATAVFIPILMYSCPQSFSTVAYFEVSCNIENIFNLFICKYMIYDF